MSDAKKDDLNERSLRALKRVLAKERDPKARAWLRGLIRGDAEPKAKKARGLPD